jgi:anaerobic selenocysteine-containing dehydrogenase
MFSFVRFSDGGPARFEGPRSEVSILTEIGRQLLGESGAVNWSELRSHAAVRRLISELVPEYEKLRDIDASRKEFHVPGRSLDEHRFPTPSGKAKFHAIPLPPVPSANGTLRLMTLRSEGQFNTVVYDEDDIYRGQERRDVILLNPADIERFGLKPDQRVRVKSDTGEMRNILARPFDIRAGNAMMYYPESNVLVSKAVDPLSKTPAFKNVSITVQPEDSP